MASSGYVVIWTVVDLYRTVMPFSLRTFGFAAVRPARAVVLISATL